MDHLRGDRDFQRGSTLASLIARYATRASLPQVLQELDANIGKWACDIQNPLLGYVLRLDPESARPRIEKAIAAQRKNSATCDVLCGVALIHYDPLLEELAIRALDNRRDIGDAIGLLGGFGSTAAEAVLWRHYERWCQRWAGREAQINLEAVSAQFMQHGGTDNLSLGRSLARAITEGRGWLTDEAKLQRLRAMSKVPTIQYELELDLEKWRPALSLSIFSCADQSPGLFATVAHYELDSLDALKEKLSQFPPGTKFELSLPSRGENQSCVDDLRAFLTNHQFTFTDWKPGE